MPKKRAPQMITATEVADFVYCAKAWRLKRDGEIAESPRLEPGVEFHVRHGDRVSLASGLRSFGLLAALFALILLIAALLLRS
jgi:hypothetical protein